MYARKYYLIIYRSKSAAWIYIEANLLPEYTRGSHQQYTRAYHQPIVFLRKVTFDLLTFFAFYIHTHKINRFTKFTIHLVHPIHLVHHSSRSIFTFSLSLFHPFPSCPSPFPLLSFPFFLSSSFPLSSPLPLPFPTYLPLLPFLSTSQHPGQRLKKNGTTLSFLAKMY